MRLTKLMFSAPTTSWSPLVVVELLTLSLSIILTQTISLTNQASAFHLSFGHRLRKYICVRVRVVSIEIELKFKHLNSLVSSLFVTF